ncbi:MAG: hypothetical protein GY765_12275 [bacterium]|nr:hypothetical protein [bacterium]
MKKNLSFLMVSCVLMAVFALTGCEEGLSSGEFSFSDMYERMNEMEAEIEELKKTNDDLEGIVDSLEASATTSYASMEDRIADMEGTVIGVESTVGGFKTTVDLLTGDVVSYTVSISNLESDNSDHTKRIMTLETNVGIEANQGLRGLVGAYSSSGLSSRIGTLESRVGTYTSSGLSGRIGTLESHVGKDDRINGLSGRISSLNGRIGSIETDFDGVSRNGNNIVFSGVNVQIVNGLGATIGDKNGLGNLIIGYNEAYSGAGGDVRNGTHNVIIGPENSYTGHFGLIVGNKINGHGPEYAMIKHLFYENNRHEPGFFRP